MPSVEMDVTEGIATITFSRPDALNAIDVDTARTLLGLCETLASRTDVRVVVLSGAGRAFMAGGDLAAFNSADDPAAMASAIIKPLNQALALLASMPQPVLGSVHGPVSGAGMSIALGCDMTLAAQDAKFCLAYSAIATSIDAGGSWYLVRQLGLQRSMELALLNQRLTAEQALQMGLIARVVAPEDLQAETRALALRLAAGPTFAFGRIKSLLRQAGANSLEEQLLAEHDAFYACASMNDFREGVSAFFAKRTARFNGC